LKQLAAEEKKLALAEKKKKGTRGEGCTCGEEETSTGC
jgi:hypothetical protein